MILSEEKEKNIEKIKIERKFIAYALENGLINESDIIYLLKNTDDFGIQISEKNKYNKLKILRSIFNSPFLLCDQESLSLNIKQILPFLLKCRYETELEELNYQFKNFYIGKKEYEAEKKLLKFYYYESSKDGKNILKTGHVCDLANNIIKSR